MCVPEEKLFSVDTCEMLSYTSCDVYTCNVCLCVVMVTGFTTMCVQLKSPLANARNKVDHVYTGPVDTELAEAIFECDPEVSMQRKPFKNSNWKYVI